MNRSAGIALSSVASAVLVAILLAAFAAESAADLMVYYSFGTINPLLAGVLALGVVLVFAAVRRRWLSETVGTGIALGLGLIVLVIVTVWAVTGRVDVFLASGWAFPAQRWMLVGLAVVIVLGAGLHAWRLGLFPGRERQSQ